METINLKNADTNQNNRFTPKKTVTVKTETMMKKIIPTKNVEWLEEIEKKKFHLLIFRMVEAMYEQSPKFFRKTLNFFF